MSYPLKESRNASSSFVLQAFNMQMLTLLVLVYVYTLLTGIIELYC
jgi:hypothetical protein